LLPEKTELNFDAAAGDPLFVGDTDADCLTVGEAVCYFMELRRAQNWSRPSFDRFLTVMIMLMGGPGKCNLPGSLYRMRKFLNTRSHMDHAVHVCVNWCRHYPPGEDPSSWDKNQTCDTVLEMDSEGVALRTCKEKRFEVIRTVHGEEIRPRDWYYYFAPERTIRRWMRDPEFCMLRARRDARTGGDFWTAALAKHIDHVTGGALLSPSSFTAEDPPPQGGDPGVEYAEHRSMAISPGADDAQVWVSDIGCDIGRHSCCSVLISLFLRMNLVRNVFIASRSYSMGVGVLKCDDLHITVRPIRMSMQ
jgi:hypothetical protein